MHKYKLLKKFVKRFCLCNKVCYNTTKENADTTKEGADTTKEGADTTKEKMKKAIREGSKEVRLGEPGSFQGVYQRVGTG